MNAVDEKYEHHCSYATIIVSCNSISPKRDHSPEKQSIREAIVHLFARYLEILPLFLAAARPMKVEWKMRPYFGVLPRVFRALCENTTHFTFRMYIQDEKLQKQRNIIKKIHGEIST